MSDSRSDRPGNRTDNAWLVAGLGNPGPAYAGNRHNVGAMVLALLAERFGSRFRAHRRGRAEVSEGRLGPLPGTRVLLARPLSYMNESGGPIAALCGFFKIETDHLVVVHDELDLPFGTLRLKRGGGDGGHNGLKSIRRSLGSGDYFRVRFGISRPPGRMDPADYVLRDFSAIERKDLDWHLDRAADAVETLISDGLESAQNVFNG